MDEQELALLAGLADEAEVQANLLTASALNTSKSMSLGLIAQFQKLTADILNQRYPLRVGPREENEFQRERVSGSIPRKIRCLCQRLMKLVA